MHTTRSPRSLLPILLGLILLASSACLPGSTQKVPISASDTFQHRNGADPGASPTAAPAAQADTSSVPDGSGPVIRNIPGPIAFAGVPTFHTDQGYAPQTWHTHLVVDKRWGDDPTAPIYEQDIEDGNLLLTNGALALWTALTGTTPTGGVYSTANAAFVVADGSGGNTAANISDQNLSAGGTTVGTSISTLSCSSGTVTVTMAASHGLLVGQAVTISSVSPSNTTAFGGTASAFGYNGTFTVASTADSTHFTYSLGGAAIGCPASYSSGGLVKASTTVGTATASESSTTGTYTVSNSLVAGQVVSIFGCSVSGYNGSYAVATASGSSFTVTGLAGSLGAATGCTVLNPNRWAQPITTVTVAPSGSPNAVQFSTTVGTANGNYSWQVWSITNQGASQATSGMLNEAWPSGGLGTKSSSASWSPTLTLSEN